MTALKRARLATGMSKRQAAEYLGVRNQCYRCYEKAQQEPWIMRLTMRLWNKRYHDRYRYGGTYRRPW
jgi:DNA-binding XRE family transcriptional regulator